ncbi:aryl-sulfate sulfotransferase [Spirosoma endophyticum]|uniref:Arylsulfate sulfotransferase n=1 Tax=Spirosoma endophyticum TaxID=662367 RepID=A0A1I1W8S6_9BACT|nr:aryl-sulfate sulfotransferase [Spirosoma endophyticum]SFD91399.1 arylsulfate sulfotransferase [Spirosoma endophyticum]
MKKQLFKLNACLLIAFSVGIQMDSKAGIPVVKAKADEHASLVLSEKVTRVADKDHPVKMDKVTLRSNKVIIPNLSPTVLMDDLNFSSAATNVPRDFLVTINETNNSSTAGLISFRVFKLSAFTITYSTTSGTSNVYPGVANSNSDWDFSETNSYITVTSKTGLMIEANSNKVVGFSITRRTGVPDHTQQNMTVSVVANSGGEQDVSDNIAGAKVNATNTPSPLAFTIAADSIKLNPYGYSPLSALVNFSVSALGKTFISVRGKHGKITYVEHLFNDNGLRHSIPLIGLYANYANTVDIRVISASGDTLAKSTIIVQTGDLPPSMPTSIVAAPFDESKVAPGLILVSNYSVGAPHTPFFMDAYGEIRWILDYRSHPQLNTLNYEDGISRLRNGNFFFGDSRTQAIYEIDLLGKVINSWNVSAMGYTFHHEVREKPNGNFIVTANKPGSTYKDGVSPTVEDFVIEIDRQSGSLSTVWDLKESLDETRTNLTTPDGVQPASDWFHGNAVEYDSTDNTIMVSGRTQGVVKLDYTNHVKWILSAHSGWTTNRRGEDLNQFLLKPLDATGNLITDAGVIAGTAVAPDFEWNWYQHNITQLPNGDKLIFDNGSVREFNPSAAKYSRSVSYRIDPVNLTVQQTWTYGKERGIDTYSKVISSAQFLPTSNHVVFGPGYQVVNTTGQGGKVVEIDFATKQVVSEISISSTNQFGFHRSKKISAYP